MEMLSGVDGPAKEREMTGSYLCTKMEKDKAGIEHLEGVTFSNNNNLITLANDEICEVLEAEESLTSYLKRIKSLKRRKMSETPTTMCEIDKKEGNSSTAGDGISMEFSEKALDLTSRSGSGKDTLINCEETVVVHCLDQTVSIKPISQCCSENISEKTETAGDGISIDVPENKLREEEDLGVFSDSRRTNENSEGSVNDVFVNKVELTGANIEECPNGVSSQVVSLINNIAVERSFPGYTHTGKKLLVLDVNGLLVDISSYVPYDYDPDEIIMRKAVFKRPYCHDFLKFCFERFNVGLWSSRTRTNMEPIIDYLLGNDKQNLLFCWDQSHCTYTGFYTVEKRHKPLYLKKLKKLWDKCDPYLPWEKGVYNESNTLLLDDSPYKALCNPPYTAVFPYTYRFRDVTDNSLGAGCDLRVYLKGLAMAENVQEYVKQNPFGQRPITEKNLSWGYYQKVIEACSSPPRHESSTSNPPG